MQVRSTLYIDRMLQVGAEQTALMLLELLLLLLLGGLAESKLDQSHSPTNSHYNH